MLQGYQASCYHIFRILAAWKCDFAQSWNQRFKGTKLRGCNFSAFTKLRVSKLSAFCLLENAISAKSRSQCFKIFSLFSSICRDEKSKFQTWHDLACFDWLGSLGLAWLGLARLRFAWLSLDWFGLVWLIFAWLGLAWLGLAWQGLVWVGLASLSFA